MKQAQVVQFLKLLGVKVPADQSRSGWLVAGCPLAPWRHDSGMDKHPSFAIRQEVGDAFCNCFSCGYHGKQSDLVLDMRQLNKQTPVDTFAFGQALQLIADAEDDLDGLDLDTPDIEELLFGKNARGKAAKHVFPETWLDSFPPWDQSADARAYLKSRQVPPGLATLMGLRFDSFQRRICFPVRDFKRRLRGLHGRAIDPETDPRYRMYTWQGQNNPLIWLGESWVDLDLPIVVVEGPFDLLAVHRCYHNVVSPLFASPSLVKLRRMSDALEWVTLFDRGKGGDAGRAKVSQAMAGQIVHHLTPPEHRKDPGEMSLGETQELLATVLQISQGMAA